MAKDVAFDRALGGAIKRRRQQPSDGGPRRTQHELGVAIGLNPEGKTAAVTVSRIESGSTSVSESRLRAIASALRTTPGDLRAEAHASLLAEVREAALTAAESQNALAKVVRTTLGGPKAQDNYRRRLAIEAEVAERQNRTTTRLERLAEVQQELIDEVLTPFIAQASEVAGYEAPESGLVEDASALGLDERLAAHNQTLGRQIANTLGTTAAAAGTGAAVGGGTAAAIVTWVAASATASTGTAISTLSGAAATSATLAWLGGGSLAAGGLGVAGGTLVLASIVTLPALIAAGGVFAYQSHKRRHQATEESERIDDAEAQLAASLPDLQRVWNWAIREQKVLEYLTTIGLREVRWLTKEVALAGGSIDWVNTAPPEFKSRFASLMDVVIHCTAVLGLPILRDLDPQAVDDADRAERAEWIDLVLTDAETFVQSAREAAVAAATPGSPTWKYRDLP